MAYSGVYVFGDSLVDAGNVLGLANWYDDLPFTALPEGTPTAEEGYFAGRFTNGYTYADLLANKLIGSVTRPVFPYGYDDPWLGVPIAPFAGDPSGNNLNFAYGGAHIREGSQYIPDFDGQTDAFRDAVDGRADPNALYLITFGGNDVRNLAPTGSSTIPPQEAYAVLDAAAAKMLHELEQLVSIGAHHIVIFGLADVGTIPRYDRNGDRMLDAVEAQRSASATEYSQYLDGLIRTLIIPALENMGAKVTYVPIMDYFDEAGNLVTGALTANLPTLAALHGLTTAELTQNMRQHQEIIFFDHVHPTAQAHALLSAYAHAMIMDLPWIETLPLTGQDIDYRMSASISASGEIDQLVVSLIGGTTYRLEMLGISSLATAGSLADPTLRLLGPGGDLIAFNSDDGAGFDATMTFTVATTGNYTLQLSATGAVTGNYVLQGAAVGGAAMLAGNSYTVSNGSTIVLEGLGGVGQDVIKASVSYALSTGSEIEVLRTTNDKGKTAIDLTGNEFGQAIVGNSGNNVIEGKGGADVLTGGAGKDVFVLSATAVTNPGAANIDTIKDYGSGDIIDVSQILRVGTGIDVVAGQYVRVTTSGLVQVDLDGGGNNWVTLSSINSGGAVTLRFLSGGVLTTVSVSRVAANSSLAMAGAVAAAGLMAAPAAAEMLFVTDDGGSVDGRQSLSIGDNGSGAVAAIDGSSRSALAGESRELVDEGATAGSPHLRGYDAAHALDGNEPSGADTARSVSLTDLLQGTDAIGADFGLSINRSFVADSVAMPSADMLQSLFAGEASYLTAEAAGFLADALMGPTSGVDALLAALPGDGLAPNLGAEAFASPAHTSWDGTFAAAAVQYFFTADALAVQADLAPLV